MTYRTYKPRQYRSRLRGLRRGGRPCGCVTGLERLVEIAQYLVLAIGPCPNDVDAAVLRDAIPDCIELFALDKAVQRTNHA